MSDYVADQATSLVKRIANQLGRKASGIMMLLFNNKNAGSFGALAGFALAIFFAWKFLRSPPRPPRRKRRNAPSTSNNSLANMDPSNPEVYTQLLNLRDLDRIDGISSPVELTLGQIVRKKLNGGRKITCQLLGVILEERSPEELQKQATVRPAVVEVLSELSRICDIYLMERVLDDESEERVLAALEIAGLFKIGGLVKEKVLFCGTENGRSSFVRQLEPDWHIDTNSEILSILARFISFQLHISPAASNFVATNIFTSASLEHYFAHV